MKLARISPRALWLAHRAAAGGASTVTGVPLPATLDDCAEGPQATHYAMACFIAEMYEDAGRVLCPSKLSDERAVVLGLALVASVLLR